MVTGSVAAIVTIEAGCSRGVAVAVVARVVLVVAGVIVVVELVVIRLS